jgi:hypothetical protein
MIKSVLKLLFGIGLLVCIAKCSASANETTLQDVQKFLGNYQVSCKNMILAKPAVSHDNFLSALNQLPFDRERCEVMLKSTDINAVLEPVFKLAVLEAEQSDEMEGNHFDVWSMRRTINTYRQNTSIKLVHRNAQKMAEACKAAALEHENDKTLVCYFGGPSNDSAQTFKAIFQAMLDDSLPNDSTLCSDDPLTDETASAKPFKDMIKDKAASLPWKVLRSQLEKESFQCGAEDCVRNVMIVILPSRQMLEAAREDASGQYIGMTGRSPMVLYPRQMRIYRGERQRIGRLRCALDENGNEGNECGPFIGAKSGVCLAKEDFHVWFRVIDLLNRIEN